ncbi:MAG: SIS domain-containing protein [bacterium]
MSVLKKIKAVLPLNLKKQKTDDLVSLSLMQLPEQIKQSWESSQEINLPVGYSQFKNIIFCGMGGSNLVSELFRSVYGNKISVPFILIRDYHLPKFANSESLVIICSYSGGTEETVSCLKEAVRKKIKTICLSEGGPIKELAQKNNLPFFQLDGKYNPSNQPRYGVGAQLGAILSIMSKLKIIKFSNKDIEKIITTAKKAVNDFGLSASPSSNPALLSAKKLQGYMPLVVSAEFLSANGHILSNQINESAKNLAVPFLIPELNHHLMEGLKLPKAINSKIKFLFLTGDYAPIIAKRIAVTKKVLAKQHINWIEYQTKNSDRLFASIETLAFGSWLSFYLAQLNHENPVSIPFVNYFKAELKK